MNVFSIALVVAAQAWMAAAIPAQDTDQERLKRLEDQVRKQQEEIDKLKKRPEKPDGFEIWANPTDGLRLKTADGNLDVHVGGRFQEHLRAVLDRPDASRTSPYTFSIKGARLRMDGTFYKDYGFLVEGDFQSSAGGSAPTLQLGYVEWKKLKEFRLLMGQFRTPLSQERIRANLYGDFVEDSPLRIFGPGYDIGLQAHGSIGEGVFGYQIALVNGRSHLDSAGRSRHDDNDEKELIARLTLRPWTHEEDFLLQGLRVGVAGSMTDVDDVSITGAGVTAFDLFTPELGVTYLDPGAAGAVALDGRRTRLSAELSWALGPSSLRAEYLLRTDELTDGLLDKKVRTKAWYVALTYLLTGEEKNPETRVAPLHPFGTEGGWGAVELAARVAGVEVGDEIEDVGISLAGQSNRVTSFTFGVNWWLTRNVRISFNVVREHYHEEITFGGGREEDSLTGFLARFQIDF